MSIDREHNAPVEIKRICVGGILYQCKPKMESWDPEATKPTKKIKGSTENTLWPLGYKNAASDVGSAAPCSCDAGSWLHPACGFPSISHLWTRYHRLGTVNDLPHSGEPRVMTCNQNWHIWIQHLQNCFMTVSVTAEVTTESHNSQPISLLCVCHLLCLT